MHLPSNVDGALARWVEWYSGYNPSGAFAARQHEPDANPHEVVKAPIQDIALAILEEAERIAKREVERALAPKASPARVVCGRVLRGLAHLVDPSS
ncbi:hypothetical protein [Sorangium sp. So ce362]|uniref:hypothetical protein n=1 Tax=Sorangium sp. So ce362 TaxID=3133303 RepID=UPI003F632E3E